jgi:hypothetical protein
MVPGYKPYHRKTVSKKIKQSYDLYRHNLKEVLEKVEYCAVTCDLWKSRSGSHFICLTCHFFDDQFTYHSLIISFRRFYRRHLSVNLKAKIQQELDGLGILEKCVAITTDNANDIKSATKDLSPNCIRFSCAAHNINLVIKNGLKLHRKQINV